MTRFLRATRSVALTLAFVVAIAAPAFSLDRIQWLYSMNPPSSWMTMGERQVRLGFGQWMFNALGSGNGFFSNLSVTPGTGLNITVGPTSTNTLASLYQYLPDDTSAFGGPGATALPVDNNQITLQGLMTPAQAQNIGPLNPPGTAGQSIIYAIECKVNTVDTTSQTVNFVTSSGTVTSGSANRDRADQIFCQAKAGTASSSPVAPAIDTGYLGVSTVTVAYGASSITSGNISATTANGFYGFARLNSSGAVQTASVVSPSSTALSLNSSSGALGVNYNNGNSNGIAIWDGGTVNSVLISPSLGFQVGTPVSTYGPTAMAVNGTMSGQPTGMSVRSYAVVEYTTSGGAVGASFHAEGGTCPSGTTCTITFSPAWTSSTSYWCNATQEASGTAYISAKSASSVTFTLSQAAVLDYDCKGT